MDNAPSSTAQNTIPVRSFLKAAASVTPVGAMIVSLMNDEQTKNIEDTLQKHQEQLEILQEIVSGELHVDKAKYLETLKAALQKAKDEANDEKRKLYASYLTACCHPENAEKSNRRIFLDLIEKIDFYGIRILKELTTHYNGREALDYFTFIFKDELDKNDILIQIDYLTSYRLIENCSQDEIDKIHKRYGNRGEVAPKARLYYKRTALGDNLYKFISKGIL